MKCPNCGNEILGDSNHCSSCGKQVNNIPSNIDIINRSKNKIDAFENKVNSQNKNTSFRKFFLRMLFVIIIFISLYNFSFGLGKILFNPHGSIAIVFPPFSKQVS